MSRRSTRRRAQTRKPKSSRLVVLAAVALLLVGLGAVAFGVLQARSVRAQVTARPAETGSHAALPAAASPVRSASSSASASSVEVPNVVGLPLAEARLVLDAAGFSVRVEGAPKAGEAGSSITTQTPSAGTLATRRAVIALQAKAGSSASALDVAARTPDRAGDGVVVVIDPGHQQHSDTKPEAIGPGSHKTKAGVSGGTTGVATKLPEYEVALQISMNLKQRLEDAGVKVVMTRTTNDVQLTNSQRAKVANDAKADLFVRVHCDGSPESKVAGISTLYPGKNKWTKPYVARSKAAAGEVQSGVVRATGAVDRGINARTDLTGFNYSKMPSVLVECGFMSNPVEDRLLSSPHYQDKLASGIADGILAYLSGDAR